MTENETSSFRLGSGPIEETPEVAVPDDAVTHMRIKKYARRAGITSFLLTFALVVVFAWGYWDLQGRFAYQANTGNREIKNITAVFDDRLNELDQKFTTMQIEMVEDFAKMDKLTVKLQKNIDQLEKSMEAIDLSGTMRKEKKAMLAEMQKTFAPIKKDIDNLSQNMGAFDQRIRTQMVPLEEQVKQSRNELARLDQAYKVMAAESIDRDDLALEMLKVKKTYQQQILSETAAVRKQIGLLNEKLERLESKLRAVKAAPPPAASATGSRPGSGIQEQNLP
jgi:chromosome segregation ATPase